MASEIQMAREIDLNHPEVLPREKLVEILIERRLPSDEVEDLEKHALVELFYKFVAPLPQRLHQLRRSKRCAPESGSTKSLILSGEKKTRKRPLGDATVPCTTFKKKRGTGEESVQIETADQNLPDITNDPDSNNHRTSLECTVVRLNRSSTSGSGKVVKLNRKSLGLQLDPTISKRATDECKQEESSTPVAVEDKLEQKDTTAGSTSSTSLDEDLEQTKKKFKKVTISYKELEQTCQTKKFKKVEITWP